MAEPGPGDDTQQGAVEMEYFFTPGFMAFRKFLCACGVDDWTVSVCVGVRVCVRVCVRCVIERECVVKVRLSVCVSERERKIKAEEEGKKVKEELFRHVTTIYQLVI